MGIARAVSGGNPVGFCLGNDNTGASGLSSYSTNGMQNEKTVFPFIVPACTAAAFAGIVFTMEGCAISQGGPISSPYMRIDFYRHNYNSVTSLGSINVPVSTTVGVTGVNNTISSGNQKQTVTVNATALAGITALAAGDAIGMVFVPQGGDNSKVNAILNLFATVYIALS